MVAVDGGLTMTHLSAREILECLRSSVVLPMHVRSYDAMPNFLSYLGSDFAVQRVRENKLSFCRCATCRSNPPSCYCPVSTIIRHRKNSNLAHVVSTGHLLNRSGYRIAVPFRNEVRLFPEQRWLEFVPFLTSPARASCCPRLIAEVSGYRAIHSGAAWSPVSRLIGSGGFAAPPRPDH